MTHPAIQQTMMRRLIACLVLLVSALPALGAVTGRVASIGFQSYIRTEQWVPLVVQVTSDEPAAHTYDLQIVQSDVDGDEVVYTRPGLTVNPGQQVFRTYFRPETVNGGLPASGNADPAELGKRLRVFLFDPATEKRAVRLGVSGATPQALESGQLGVTGVGQKLILIVGRPPSVYDFGHDRVLGLAEACYFVQIDPNRLPESGLAYGAADAVVWTDADASRLDPNQKKALRDYVRGGGTLAVIQNADFGRTAAFSDMLPVTLNESVQWDSSEPLKSILQPPGQPRPLDSAGRRYDPWQRVSPPFRLANATPTDDTTFVDSWTTWPDGHRTPFIARRLFGSGCVAWLAEDVTDPTLAGIDFGWPRLWERLMDWRDTDLVLTAAQSQATIKRESSRFTPEGSRDLGASYVTGINPESRTAALISLTFIFFIGYWALAGPGSYLILAARKRVQLSWAIFAAIALIATAATIFIAQLVLRGDATVQHVSLVRARAGEPGRVMSRLGVYLPKDVRATVKLPQTQGGPPVAVTPFGVDPRYTRDDVSLRDPESQYDVAVGTDVDRTDVSLSIKFRSTLKKLQADWTGPGPGGISGQLKADDATIPLDGRLTNDTGSDLRDVIMIFRDNRQRADVVLAMPEWKKGQTFELKTLWTAAEPKLVELPSKRFGLRLFGDGKVVRGSWNDALTWFQEDLRRSMIPDPRYDDSGSGYGHSWPLVSLFGRCPTMTNIITNNADDASRIDLFRRGVRDWDASPAVAAGALVVLGKSSGALPLPLTVDGDVPKGDGALFFQSIVPIDRSAFNVAVVTPEKPSN